MDRRAGYEVNVRLESDNRQLQDSMMIALSGAELPHAGRDLRDGDMHELMRSLVRKACSSALTSEGKAFFFNNGWVAGHESYMLPQLFPQVVRIGSLQEVCCPTVLPPLPQELRALSSQAHRWVTGTPGTDLQIKFRDGGRPGNGEVKRERAGQT